MAIVQNPIVGRAKQKFGNAVFSTQFGQNTLRTKPVSVKNPRTLKQMIIRKRMKQLVGLFRQIVSDINTAYGSSVKGMSPFNRVISLNMKCAFDAGSDIIVPSRLVICDNSSEARPDSFVVTAPHADQLAVTWVSHFRNSNEQFSDIYFYAYDPVSNKIWKLPEYCTYSNNQNSFLIPNYTGQAIHLYSMNLDYVNLLNGSPRQIFTYCGSAVMV
jgi:hypothetical protein